MLLFDSWCDTGHQITVHVQCTLSTVQVHVPDGLKTMMQSQEAARTAVEAHSDQELRVPFYCEENVWRLAYRLKRQRPHDTFAVVFVSNHLQRVAMFHQRAASNPEHACCWDYHVILLCKQSAENHPLVYDLDSLLPYPTPMVEYLTRSFPLALPNQMAPFFRIVVAELYLAHFASSRSHMFDRQKQTWTATPPTYACINVRPGVEFTNIDQYLDFSNAASEQVEPDDYLYGFYGFVVSKDKLISSNFISEYFKSIRSSQP